MRKILIAGVLGLMAFPAAAPAAEGDSPAQRCKQMRTAMGETAFKNEYGTNDNKSNAFGKCVSRMNRSDDQNEESSRQNAAQECRAEREDSNFASGHGGKTFAEFYGTNENDRNAFGKCVSGKASDEGEEKSEAQQQKRLRSARAAVKACQTARRANPTAFKAAWGGKSNAMGKCVSRRTRS